VLSVLLRSTDSDYLPLVSSSSSYILVSFYICRYILTNRRTNINRDNVTRYV